jgi:hypothetical protein
MRVNPLFRCCNVPFIGRLSGKARKGKFSERGFVVFVFGYEPLTIMQLVPQATEN